MADRTTPEDGWALSPAGQESYRRRTHQRGEPEPVGLTD